MKKNHEFGHYTNNVWTKTVRVMKLTTILIFLAIFSVSAEGFSQGGSISLKMEDASLKEVFQVLKANSDYTFVYSEDMVSKIKVDQIDIENASFDRVLSLSLEGTDLEYFVEGDVVVIRKKAPVVEQPIQQEKKTLQGKVTDKDGLPLPGVSVVIKGTNIGMATDINGEYTMVLDIVNPILVYSFVGMLPQEIRIEKQSVQDVTLLYDSEQMAEVVVTGYQTISKERATGSFVTLDSDNIANNPNSVIGDNLESLVAGVQTTTDENGNPKITIRGASSLTGKTNPLIVVDGFAINDIDLDDIQDEYGLPETEVYENPFETINKNDIEKITVLKDAAAASIWGARAANGVIVITTKKGSKKKGIEVSFEAYTKVSEDVDLGYANPIANSKTQLEYEMRMWEMGAFTPYVQDVTSISQNMTKGSVEFAAQQAAYAANGGTGIAPFTLDTPGIQTLMGQSYKRQVEDLMLRKATSQNYNLTIRGQGERNKYSLSIMYNNEKKVMQADKGQSALINFRNSMKVADWLDFDFSVMTNFKSEKNGGVGLAEIKEMSPYELLVDENGNYNHIEASDKKNLRIFNHLKTFTTGWAYDDYSYNPLQDMRSQDFRTKTFTTRINAGLKFKIADGIKYNVGMQYSNGNIHLKNRYKEESYYTRDRVNTYNVTNYEDLLTETPQVIDPENGGYGVPKGEIAYMKNIQTRTYLIRNQLSLNKTFGDHAINFIAGTELNWNEQESKDDQLYGYNDDKFTSEMPASYTDVPLAFSAGSSRVARGGELKWNTNKFFSLFSNMAYTYKDKYTLSASVRTDASNITVEDAKFRYAPFWSVGGSWQLTKEDFATDIEWLNRATFRGTYGVNGNVPLNTAQVPLITYQSGSSWFGQFGAGRDHALLTDLGNPTLGWEEVKQLNLGLDFAVFGNKLFGSIEYYNKKSESMVAEVALASISGTDSQAFNVAEMENKGVELNLNADIKITKDLTWRPIFNFSYNKSLVTDVQVNNTQIRDLSVTNYVEGYAFAPTWSFSKSGNVNEFGIPTILGANGIEYAANLDIDGTGVDAPDVLNYRGSLIAPYTSSLTNEFKYKGFSLLTTISGKFGHYMQSPGFGYGDRVDGMNYHEDLEGIMAGKADEMGLFELPATAVGSYYSNALWLDAQVQKADFIRFKEIMLSYTLPKSLTSKLGTSKIKFYTHISNVGLLWTANDKDIDPEYPQGLSFFKPERTYTFGVNVNF